MLPKCRRLFHELLIFYTYFGDRWSRHFSVKNRFNAKTAALNKPIQQYIFGIDINKQFCVEFDQKTFYYPQIMTRHQGARGRV